MGYLKTLFQQALEHRESENREVLIKATIDDAIWEKLQLAKDTAAELEGEPILRLCCSLCLSSFLPPSLPPSVPPSLSLSLPPFFPLSLSCSPLTYMNL